MKKASQHPLKTPRKSIPKSNVDDPPFSPQPFQPIPYMSMPMPIPPAPLISMVPPNVRNMESKEGWDLSHPLMPHGHQVSCLYL